MDDIARLGIEVDSRDVKKAEKDLDSLGKEADKTEKKVKTLSDAFANNLKSAIGGIGLSFLAKDILDTNREMESLRAALTSTMGSIEAGKSAFQTVVNFAKETPYEVSGLTESFIMLKNMGIEPTIDVMTALTDQASKLGGKQETLTSIALQLGQAHSKGKLQMQDIVILAERGVPIFDLLSKVTGKNTSELAKMSEKGELTVDIIDKVIVKMGELSKGSNANAMDTLNGKISNLSDSWHTFEDTLLNDKSEGIIKSIVASASAALDMLSRNMSTTLDSQIAHAKARIETFDSMGVVGKAVADYSGYDINVEKNRLDSLTKQKQKIDDHKKVMDAMGDAEKWYDEVVAQSEAKKTEARNKTTVSHRSNVNSSISAEKTRVESINEVIEAIRRETEQVGMSSIEIQRSNELQTATNKAKGEEIAIITESLKLKWQEADANERQNKQWEQAIADANEYYDIRKEINDIIRNGVTDNSFNTGLGSLRDSLDKGSITEDQFKEQSSKLSKAYNTEFIDPAKDATDQLSAFAEQAAKNMQSSFADFLFDPFAKGTDGMMMGFLNAIRRMAAEAASAAIMESLFGKKGADGADGGGIGGLAGSAISGISSLWGSFGGGFNGTGPLQSFGSSGIGSGISSAIGLLGSFFHEGGRVGAGGVQRPVSAAVFDNAPRFHSGTLPGLKADEVPAILQKGEEVLSKDQVKNSEARPTSINQNININISTPNADSFRKSERQLKQQISRATSNV